MLCQYLVLCANAVPVFSTLCELCQYLVLCSVRVFAQGGPILIAGIVTTPHLALVGIRLGPLQLCVRVS